MSKLDIKKVMTASWRDDDYETSSDILKDLLPYLDKFNGMDITIYDPFYCQGTVVKEWEKLGYKCINEKKDAFNREHPQFDIMISNIPFSLKKQVFELAFKLDKPFILLMPIESIAVKWLNQYWDKLQFLIPNGRLQFLKNGKPTKSCWFNTMWVCYNINLKEKIIRLN